jgi:hypothetical protein
MEEEFYSLLKTWMDETCLKSYHDKTHYAYKKILNMGTDIIPLLLENIDNSWLPMCVLEDLIKDHSHIPYEHYGNFPNLQKDWLKWGKDNGYL